MSQKAKGKKRSSPSIEASRASIAAHQPLPLATRHHGDALNWQSIGLALLAGVLQFTSYAPLGIFPASWVGLAILAMLWRRGSVRTNVVTGLAFSVALYGLGIGWIYTSLSKYDGYATWIVIGATIYTLGLQTLVLLFAAVVTGRFNPRPAVHYLILLPAAWALMEMMRGFTNFPWLAVGYGQVDSPLAAWLPILGVYGVSWMTMLLAGCLALVVEMRGKARWRPAVGAVALLGVAYGLSLIAWTQPTGKPVSVAIVQGNYSSTIKWLPAQLQPTIAEYVATTREAIASHHPDLIVWPETAIPAQYQRVQPQLEALSRELADARTTLLAGTISRIGRGDTAKNYNAVVSLGGEFQEYRKTKLVPMTEYLPWVLPDDYIAAQHKEGIAIFSHGEPGQEPLRIGDGRARVSVCFEILAGDYLRHNMDSAGYQVTITNDDLFIESRMPYQHVEITRVRAMETQRDFVRAANSGISTLIAYNGDLLASSSMSKREVLFGTIQPRTGLTPFARWGDWAMLWLGLAGLGLGAAVSAPQR